MTHTIVCVQIFQECLMQEVIDLWERNSLENICISAAAAAETEGEKIEDRLELWNSLQLAKTRNCFPLKIMFPKKTAFSLYDREMIM